MTDKEQLIIPSVHLNGTSKKELIMQLENAHYALGEAVSRLQATAPHMRDYYVKENAEREMNHAMAQFIDRRERLLSVMDEISHIVSAIFEKYP